MRGKVFVSGLALGLLMSSAHAQSSDREVSSSEAPAVFKSSTNLVQVPVIVRDNARKPVGSLRAEDFQLFDNGKTQVISRFTVENFAMTESLQKRQAELSETGGKIAGILPNRFVALLMDDVNTVPDDFPHGRNAALHYIDSLPPDVRVAVYSTSGDTVLDFTDDHERLHKALNEIRATAGDMHYVKVADGCTLGYYTTDLIVYHNQSQVICSNRKVVDVTAAILQAEMKHTLDTFADPNELAYFKALRDVIAKMAVLPGQRTVLAISPGQYVPDRFQPLMNEVIADAIRAKVVVNGLDSRGVAGSFDTASERSATNMPGLIELGEHQERMAFMEDLASGTGGIFVQGSNDLDGAVQTATSVPEYVYVLGFSPSDFHLDGKQHKLRVALRNPRGMTVQARASYFAAAYSADPTDEIRRRIEEAFFSSEESNALPARIQTQYFREGDDVTLTVATKVDATKLAFHKEEGRNRDSLTLVVGLFDQNGNSVSAFQKDIQMRLKDETLSAWLKSGIETSTDFHVKPGKYLVRLVVRESGGSAMAEQSTGVDIPW